MSSDEDQTLEAELNEVLQSLEGTNPNVSNVLIQEQADERPSADVRALLGELSVAEKVKAALMGNATVRSLLVLSPLRIVSLAVLKNPRIQLKEVYEFSKNKNTSDYVLRAISFKKEWIADYALKVAIISNPKTPKDVALKWIKFLRKTDLKKVSQSREVSSAVATAARKLYSQLAK
jgi:hypothetical protein